MECLTRLAQQVLEAEDFIYSVLCKRMVSSDASDDRIDSAQSMLVPWVGSGLPMAKRARSLSGEDDDPWRRPPVLPTSTLQSLSPVVLLTVSLECYPLDLFLDPPVFSPWGGIYGASQISGRLALLASPPWPLMLSR